MGFVNEKRGDQFVTTDEQKEITLYRKGVSGGSSDKINLFEMVWRGGIVAFSARPEVIDNGGKGEIHHDILSIEIPDELKSSETEITQDITEALTVFGSYWNTDMCDKVAVTFPPKFEN